MSDPIDTWVLIAAGLIAHADERIEVEEWDIVVDLLDDRERPDLEAWLEILADPERVSAKFEALEPPSDREAAEAIAYRAWQIALADGEASEIEASVHARITDRLGIAAADAERLRAEWSALAARRGEVAVGLAAHLAHIDGALDPAEAAKFAEILERVPVSVARRLELGERLHAPPSLETLAESAAELPRDERLEILRTVAPMVRASARGDAEMAALHAFARLVDLDDAEVDRIVASR
ncbi:MAG: hypothetical protein D6705_02625 [Deltaproteobacteria bacterium]|nr:MAG: hypothetical protein D6705_02625 [Deltaproteobacteria bacterium]